jgi:hypothetical protein
MPQASSDYDEFLLRVRRKGTQGFLASVLQAHPNSWTLARRIDSRYRARATRRGRDSIDINGDEIELIICPALREEAAR